MEEAARAILAIQMISLLDQLAVLCIKRLWRKFRGLNDVMLFQFP